MRFATPLRYPGGKGKLSNYVKLIMLQNKLLDGHYVEPYAGGAGVALTLLFEEYVSNIHINDLSRPVFAFWHCVLNQTEELCQLILDTEINMSEWKNQKSIQEKPDEGSLLELGFSTFFLNRTNRSGILKGGVIGGKEQAGDWTMSARYNKKDLIQRIKKIARYRCRISIYNMDAADFIREIIPSLPSKTLVYLDPPYFDKGAGLYDNFYEPQDHIDLSLQVSNIARHWIISYDNVPEIIPLYEGYRMINYKLNYSAGIKQKGSEVMFFCDNLSIPPTKNPTKVSTRYVNAYTIDSYYTNGNKKIG